MWLPQLEPEQCNRGKLPTLGPCTQHPCNMHAHGCRMTAEEGPLLTKELLALTLTQVKSLVLLLESPAFLRAKPMLHLQPWTQRANESTGGQGI